MPCAPLRRFEVAAELILEHAVDALDLLLLAQLQAVADHLRLPRLAVLPRREVALLDRALLREAALALEEQLHRLAAAEPADRIRYNEPFTLSSASGDGIRCAESASRRGSTSLRCPPSAARGSPTRGRSRALDADFERAHADRLGDVAGVSAACVAANGVPLREPLKPMPPALDQPRRCLRVGDGDHRVVERRLDVRQAVVHDAFLPRFLNVFFACRRFLFRLSPGRPRRRPVHSSPWLDDLLLRRSRPCAGPCGCARWSWSAGRGPAGCGGGAARGSSRFPSAA